jgi:hypothetical protein
MSEKIEICLGNNGHTLFSDEVWYLVLPPEPAIPFLEARFQTDAPERTGWPTWINPDNDNVVRDGHTATWRLPLTPMPVAGEGNRFASISNAIWNQCVRECVKLAGSEKSTQS